MVDKIAFLNFFNDITKKIDKTKRSSGIFSFCIELPHQEIIDIYSLFIEKYNFSIFWKENNNNSFIALDKCKSIKLNGDNRFQIAKNFNNKILKNIINLDNKYDFPSIPKIFYLFSFKENLNKKDIKIDFPVLEGVLPRILIINNGKNILIRMSIEINRGSSIREDLLEFWSVRDLIISKKYQNYQVNNINISIDNFYKSFDQSSKLLNKQISEAINLINNGYIEKLVLGSRLLFNIKNKLNIIGILHKLILNQPNACIYLWKKNNEDLLFGASPEKLFSFEHNILKLEAIAGTEKIGKDMNQLLKSNKDLREHNFVIDYLIENLQFLNINNFKKGELKVKVFGNILHLYTLISAEVNKICPFELLDRLHPSPAVCGSPKEKALEYIDIIENFDRGNYASPFGWVDSEGNADFRVALRGASLIQSDIELIAGSGIVKGSNCQTEIEEIKLKLESLANQIFDNNLINDMQ